MVLDKQHVQDYAELVEFLEGKFDKIDERFNKLESRMGGLENRMVGLENRMDNIEAKVDNLPTKAYIDAKMASLWGLDIKGDQKVGRLLEILKDNKTLTEDQFNELGQYRISPI